MPEFEKLFATDKGDSTLLVLFIPSADRDGESLGKKEQRRWVRQALKLLGEKLGGATAFPRGWGVWRDDAQGAQLVWDKPVLIQCFTNENELERHAGPLRQFLTRLGQDANQGAVAFVIDRTFYEIHFPVRGG